MFKILPYLFILLWLTIQISEAGQTCASCSGIKTLQECQHHVECNDNEKCYIHQYRTESGHDFYDLGCIRVQACPFALQPIVGKRAEGHHYKCMTCCNDTRLCNQYAACNASLNTGLTLPKDCSELVVSNRQSGSYVIYPYGVIYKPVYVYCKFDSNNAWTVIQRRFDGSVSFHRNWDTYKRGFGSSNGEYWLGNDVIHELTSHRSVELRIIMTDFQKVTKFADYSTFQIADEAHAYRLTIRGYSGTAGDSLRMHDGMMFSTFDRDNDASSVNCAATYGGAWWHNACFDSNLNGVYHSTFSDSSRNGIEWRAWHEYYSLKTSTMMIKKT